MFAAADLLSCSSSYSAKYKHAWITAKMIRSFISYAGECPDTWSRALSIVLNHKEVASIMAVTGAIFPKQMPIQLPDMNRSFFCPMQHLLVINQNKRRNIFFISNIVYIVSSQPKKADQNEGHAIKDLLQCITSSAYRRNKRLLQNVDIWLLKSTIQR